MSALRYSVIHSVVVYCMKTWMTPFIGIKQIKVSLYCMRIEKGVSGLTLYGCISCKKDY